MTHSALAHSHSVKEPLISVCLPVYNAEKYVESAVVSILRQSEQSFELLIIDDGSTDDSRIILSQLALSDSRIHFQSRSNRGLIFTLNELLMQCRGRYIARMDADDISRPDRFNLQKSYLENYSDCVVVGSRCLLIDPEGLPLAESVDTFSHSEIDAALLRTALALCHPASMIRRSAIEQIGGGYNSEFPHAEDLDFFLRLGEVGRLHNLEEVLLEYRCHVMSISHRHTAQQSISAWKAVSLALERRGLAALEIDAESLTVHVESRAQLHRKWSWWAVGNGYLRTARKHAWKAFVADPMSKDSIHLLATIGRDSLVKMR